MITDADLLGRFAVSRDAAAFAELSKRYLPLVYASARRRTKDATLANDVSQAVFVVLSQKAGKIKIHQPLGDWLLTVTRYAAANAMKQQRRRARHEAAATRPEVVMPPETNPLDEAFWIAQLDAGLDRLPAVDRRALLLRYYNASDYPDVAAALNISESAARKRVARAVARLRQYFVRHQVVVPSAALTAGLSASLAMKPSPALAAAVTAAGTAAPAGPIAALTKGTLLAMFNAKLKAIAIAIIFFTGLSGGIISLTGAIHQSSQFANAAPPPATIPATHSVNAVDSPPDPVKGWLKVEYHLRPNGKPNVSIFEPATHRSVILRPDGHFVEGFIDPPTQTGGLLIPETHSFVLGPHSASFYFDFPYTEKGVLQSFIWEPGAPEVVSRTINAAGECVTVADIDQSAAPPPWFTDAPTHLQIYSDPATGMVSHVVASPGPDGKGSFDALIVTRLAAPPMDFDHPDQLPLPSGTKLVDNRPSPEIRALLTQLARKAEEDLGVGTYAVISHDIDPHNGEPQSADDAVTICTGTARRYVIAEWEIADKNPSAKPDARRIPRPVGWPSPTFKQIMTAIGSARPRSFTIFNGESAWEPALGSPIEWKMEGQRVACPNPPGRWLIGSASGQFWGWLEWQGLSVDTKLTLQKNSQNHRVLEATSTLDPEDPDHQRQACTVRVTLGDDPLLYPIEIVRDKTITQDNGGHAIHILETIASSPSTTLKSSNGTLIPVQWRTINQIDEGSTLRFHQLIPAEPGDTIPDAWFNDPAITWPQ